MKRVIEKTDDGSATLFVPELNEHYHSTKGARTESQHIFINMGLKASAAPSPHILEIGFGTGLNAWLTLEEAERSGRNVHYTGLELYPLEWQMVEQLGYIEQPAATDLFRAIHTSPWEEEISFTPHFTLCKVQADVNEWITHLRRIIHVFFSKQQKISRAIQDLCNTIQLWYCTICFSTFNSRHLVLTNTKIACQLYSFHMS